MKGQRCVIGNRYNVDKLILATDSPIQDKKYFCLFYKGFSNNICPREKRVNDYIATYLPNAYYGYTYCDNDDQHPTFTNVGECLIPSDRKFRKLFRNYKMKLPNNRWDYWMWTLRIAAVISLLSTFCSLPFIGKSINDKKTSLECSNPISLPNTTNAPTNYRKEKIIDLLGNFPIVEIDDMYITNSAGELIPDEYIYELKKRMGKLTDGKFYIGLNENNEIITLYSINK